MGLLSSLCAALAACGSAEPPKHRPFPEVPTLDGALLSPLHLTTIVASNDTDGESFFEFASALHSTHWWKTLASEYHLGDVEATHQLFGPAITADLTDHQVFRYIDDLVAAHPEVAPDGRSLYVLYLPANIRIIHQGMTNTGCKIFGAYHTSFGARGDNWAVVQRCVDQNPIENMTIGASHEIIEAVTDPNDRGYRLPQIATQTPWTDTIWNAYDRRGGAELADLCTGSFWVEQAFVAQRIWSNAAARRGGDPCVPPLNQPYYNVDFDQDWYSVAAGGSVSIQARGWATGDVGRWPIRVSADGGDVSFTLDPPTGTTPLIGANGTVDLTVTAPADAPSGSYAVLRVVSERPASPPGLTDGGHVSYVGVYIP
jgi:hypothetical protein